jgi:O-antigen/teichoic acid export membrane protein
VTRVLLTAAVVLAVGRAIAAVLKGINRPLVAGAAEVLALVVTFASLAILLPTLGILGAGIASFLAYCVATTWSLTRAAAALEMTPTQLLLGGVRGGAAHPGGGGL